MRITAVEENARKMTLEELIDEKLQILEDFYIVDKNNYEYFKTRLVLAVHDHPTQDPHVVLDHYCHKLIVDKLSD